MTSKQAASRRRNYRTRVRPPRWHVQSPPQLATRLPHPLRRPTHARLHRPDGTVDAQHHRRHHKPKSIPNQKTSIFRPPQSPDAESGPRFASFGGDFKSLFIHSEPATFAEPLTVADPATVAIDLTQCPIPTLFDHPLCISFGSTKSRRARYSRQSPLHPPSPLQQPSQLHSQSPLQSPSPL